MKLVLVCALFCGCISAQDLSFYIDPTNGSTACSEVPASLQTFPSNYQFPDTPVGGSTDLWVDVVNTSGFSVLFGTAYVGNTPGSSMANPNFTITGQAISTIMAPGSCIPFTLHFAPVTTGVVTGYFQAAYSVDGAGTIVAISTLQGNATPAQVPLTCTGSPSCNASVIQASTLIDFGNVAVGSQAAVTFTLTNSSSSALNTPTVALQTQVFASSPFSLNISALPPTLAPSASGTFVVTFIPAQTAGTSALFQAVLVVGSVSYELRGIATPPSSTPPGSDGPQICYTDSTGVRTCPNPATPINFTPTAVAANTSTTLNFVILNPNPVGTSFADITLPSTPSVTGPGFTMTNLALTPEVSGITGSASAVQAGQSVDIPPGWGLTFQLTFTSAQAGTGNGTLSIPTIGTFQLVGTTLPPLGSDQSVLPGLAITCNGQPCTTLTSQQQVQIGLTIDKAATVESIPTVTMSFIPSVSGVSDDPAVQFVSPVTGRAVQVTFAVGSTVATYNGQSHLTLQTGSTAGTISFIVSLNGQQMAPVNIKIPATPVVFTSTLAHWEPPNLVITLDGYDNTYSADNVTFTFYDGNGNVVPSTPAPQNVIASDFHEYFFGPSDVGGMFGLQATFPVTDGNANQVASVVVTISNSAGPTSTNKISFQ